MRGFHWNKKPKQKLNQLSPVGKVGNVVLWDSFSVSISCLRVHLILSPHLPFTSIQNTLPHRAPDLAANQPSLKVEAGMMSWAYAFHCELHAYFKRVQQNILHERCRFVVFLLYIHLLLIQFDARNEFSPFPSIMLSITRFRKLLKS